MSLPSAVLNSASIPVRFVADAERYKALSTTELRDSFLFAGLFQPGMAKLHCIDYDRSIIGGVMPLEEPVRLESDVRFMATEYFMQRREVGLFNIGGPGLVTIDGTPLNVNQKECLYIGKDHRDVLLESADPSNPAKYFLASYPAHTHYPVQQVRLGQHEPLRWGDETNCNKRILHPLLNPATAQTCQLTMGCTELQPGSSWNTFPCHLHYRRSETYLYFDLDDDARVFHFLGTPSDTRHLVMKNEEAVFSPFWSVHYGAGTRRYSFLWAMGGENRDILNVDRVPIEDLR
jgi:4-deoxy-L-threo-5-hexosulose-uronate ketol-isomerase